MYPCTCLYTDTNELGFEAGSVGTNGHPVFRGELSWMRMKARVWRSNFPPPEYGLAATAAAIAAAAAAVTAASDKRGISPLKAQQKLAQGLFGPTGWKKGVEKKREEELASGKGRREDEG
ncbi:hypothetical protein HZH68_011100 [Vespula germanica]|uniref:Uncharacterized protein n=1 Tax=Vespula germanica TaxID=30212 RepID=A0A834JQM8_VESGE|nr:hypothetical protein HZH68_011100 [Vespula germanica]